MERVKRYKGKEVKTVGLEQDRSDMELLDNACQHSKDSSSIPQTLFLLLYLFTILLFPIAFYLFTFLPFYSFTFLPFKPNWTGREDAPTGPCYPKNSN